MASSTFVSIVAWGLGYFGMPRVLLRFMAIRSEKELTRSRRIATVWVVISLTVAVFIGVVGRTLFPPRCTTASEAENVFILLSTNLLPPCWLVWLWRASWLLRSALPTPIC